MTEESTEQEARVCGTCGSDDPAWMTQTLSRNRFRWDKVVPHHRCPDPFHNPAPEDTPASSVGEAVFGEEERSTIEEWISEADDPESGVDPENIRPVRLLLADHTRLAERVEEAEAAMVKARRQRDDYGSAQGVEAALRMEAEQEAKAYREALETLSNPDSEKYHRDEFVRRMADFARAALDPTPTEEDE